MRDKLFTFKEIVIILAIIASCIVCIDTAATAASSDTSCDSTMIFKAGSGLFEGEVCSATLLAEFMVAIDMFFFRLAIVLSVMMITIGGFQWLIAMGNASKVATAKETIQFSVIGLLLALAASLIFSQIDKSFVELKVPELTVEEISVTCNQYPDRTSCEERTKEKGCRWICNNKDLEYHKSPTDSRYREYLDCMGSCAGDENYNPLCTDALIKSYQQKVSGDQCYITPEEKNCVDSLFEKTNFPKPSLVCCVGQGQGEIMWAIGKCTCAPPAGKSAPLLGLGSYWSQGSDKDCALKYD